jgi:hypothetical protein
MGEGWWGVDYHWQSRHAAELPFREFWDSLCAGHRANHPETVLAEPPVQALAAEAASIQAAAAAPSVQAVPAQPVPAQADLPEPPEPTGRRARIDRNRRPFSHRHSSGAALPGWLADGYHPDPARTFPAQAPDISWRNAGPLPGPGHPGLKRG